MLLKIGGESVTTVKTSTDFDESDNNTSAAPQHTITYIHRFTFDKFVDLRSFIDLHFWQLLLSEGSKRQLEHVTFRAFGFPNVKKKQFLFVDVLSFDKVM